MLYLGQRKEKLSFRRGFFFGGEEEEEESF